MISFLESVAKDILNKYGTDLSRTAVVFPNKRASLFLNGYLAQYADRPMWSPVNMTISELFRSHSVLAVADPIKQVCDLYKCFIDCTGMDETLDHFYGWGQLMLSDFDDIDKNMADASKVFANVADIHELDDLSYLSPDQIEAIQKFFSNFSADHNTELKRRFLQLWSKFYDIYAAFNERMASQNLAYEGALYRKVATDESVKFEFDRYLFIGFNVLQKVEQQLFSRLMKQDKAAFYWDFDRYYVSGQSQSDNEAGHYIASYLHLFPNELDCNDDKIYDNWRLDKDILFISSPSENAQARYASQWLKERQRIADGRRTAIVLCDESLLKTVIHALPDEVEQANITTGYPLAQTPMAALLLSLLSLQTTGYMPHSDRFRLKAVCNVLSHPYASYLSAASTELLEGLKKTPIYYLSRQQLSVDDGTTLLFGSRPSDEDLPLTAYIVKWVLKVLKALAHGSDRARYKDQLFQEALFQSYTMVNRIDSLISAGDLLVDTSTLIRLVTQLIQTTSIPFHGEPAVGLQIMGVLETRNIDFEHILILSCNDGNMPKGVNDTSFIPYSIRKAYDLTTIDNKVAIYAYYFNRLLQRAKDITIMYNDSATDTSTGEMSRFMMQMLVEGNHDIAQKKLHFELTSTYQRPTAIEKNEKTMRCLLGRFDVRHRPDKADSSPLLTPSAINKYMRCQLQFFYNYVANLHEDENPTDADMQQRLFGNIFHHAAEIIYKQLMDNNTHRISKESIQALIKAKTPIEMAVDTAFNKELFNVERSDKKPEYDGLQLINREVVITYLCRLLSIDAQLAPFDIVGLEVEVAQDMKVDCGNGNTFTTRIGGRIDRIDELSEGRIRVVDYKTGRDTTALMGEINDVFNMQKTHSDYYLQTFIYSMIVRHAAKLNAANLPVSPALLFIQSATGNDYDPTLKLRKTRLTDIADVETELKAMLSEKVNEMFNPDIPFVPTDNTDTCRFCPYHALCF